MTGTRSKIRMIFASTDMDHTLAMYIRETILDKDQNILANSFSTFSFSLLFQLLLHSLKPLSCYHNGPHI